MDRTEQHSTTHEEKSTESSFPFVSGVLALDLVNTEVLARRKPYDLLSSPEEAERWWAEASLHHAERAVVRGEAERPVDAALLEALQRLRTALRHLFMAQISQHPIRASDLDELNHALALGHHLLLQDPAGALIPAYKTNQPGSGAV